MSDDKGSTLQWWIDHSSELEAKMKHWKALTSMLYLYAEHRCADPARCTCGLEGIFRDVEDASNG